MDKRIAEQLLKLSHLPNCPINSDNLNQVVDSYAETLGDLSDELLQAAVQAYKASGTFFPAPGDLRNKAMELQMLSIKLPTPAEAWTMFLNVRVRSSNKRCDEAIRLMKICEEATTNYGGALHAYSTHIDTCPECVWQGKDMYEYEHPVVAKVVELLGGRDVIKTDNTVADRARFIQAFKDLVDNQKAFAILPSQVKDFVALNQPSEFHKLVEKASV